MSINYISNLKCNLGLANAENPILGLHFSLICNLILIPNPTPTKLEKILLKKGTALENKRRAYRGGKLGLKITYPIQNVNLWIAAAENPYWFTFFWIYD